MFCNSHPNMLSLWSRLRTPTVLCTVIILCARFLHPCLDEPPIDRHSGPMAQEHSNLHHPPVCDRIHRQFVVEDGDLEDSHPGKEADLEEQERQEVRFGSPPQRFWSVVTTHGRDGVVLEDDTEGDREGEIYDATSARS